MKTVNAVLAGACAFTFGFAFVSGAHLGGCALLAALTAGNLWAWVHRSEP